MDTRVRSLMTRIADDPAFADRYFADPSSVLAELDIPEVERPALCSLDREAALYMIDAAGIEPEVALEHPSNNAGNRHMTVVIAFLGCIVFVLTWLILRPA
ncbi:hypothetical protein LBMAG42_47550 [Deltaproteobacteria bacterium]|nr:hypothetical protein LBMAG42_47550 [Deltaproteobacteria bacterium]